MLFNLLDMAIPTLPILIVTLLDDAAIFILGAIGVIALIAVVTIFYIVSKKKKAATNSKQATTSKPEEKDGEK